MWGAVLAHVRFRGTIRERTVEPYLKLLAQVERRRKFRGLLLDISSGGGADIPSTDLYHAVKRVAEQKPVVVSIGSVGASGAYLAALGAHRIYAYEESEVGSIGVILPSVSVEGLLTKLGIQVDLLHHGRHKDAYQGIRPLTPEEREKLLEVGRVSYDSFIALVARERHRPVEEIQALATGEFWSGRRALDLGLVDALGDRRVALEDLARRAGVPPRRTVELTPPRPLLERILGGASASAASALTGVVRTSLTEALEDLVLESLRPRG